MPSTRRLVPAPNYTALIETGGDGKANFPGREQSAASALAALQIISDMEKQVISINYSAVMERGFGRSPTC